jgi:uncharacterized protein (DUF1015 family)
MDKEEFNRVDGLAKDVWIILWMAHEGSKSMRMAKIEMLEGQLNRFVMFDDETPQDMFNWLKKMVQEVDRSYIDQALDEGLHINELQMVALIRQGTTCKRMTFDDLLGRIINHEMYIEETNHIKNLYKGVTTTKKQDIALKASNKSKKKQIVIESSSEEEEEDDKEKEYDEDEMTLFMKRFISKRRPFKGDRKEKTISQRVCYNYGKN